MKKNLLLTVSPTEALNVLNGKQLALLRKRVPKGYVGWCYGVVTLGKKHEALIDFSRFAFVKEDNRFHFVNLKNSTPLLQFRPVLNGKIPFKFWYEGYSKLQYEEYIGDYIYGNMQLYEMKTFISNLCIDYEQIEKYGNGKDLYAISITKLEIFDKPMELGEMYVIDHSYDNSFGWVFEQNADEDGNFYAKLTKSPSTYQYVWVKE